MSNNDVKILSGCIILIISTIYTMLLMFDSHIQNNNLNIIILGLVEENPDHVFKLLADLSWKLPSRYKIRYCDEYINTLREDILQNRVYQTLVTCLLLNHDF